jgi:hypothetical protein
MYFLYKYECGIVKSIEITIRRGLKAERRIMEGMNQFRV